MKISKNAVFYNAAVLALSNIVLQIMGFAYRIFISRAAGAEGMGVYQLVFPFYSVAMAITLSGLSMASSNISAERYVLGDINGIRKLVRTCILIFLVLFSIITVATVVFSDFISDTVTGDYRTRISILILLPCLFFTGFENIIKGSFFGIKKVRPAIIAQFIEQTVRFSAAVFLLYRFSSKNPAVTTALIVCAMVISEIFSSTTLILFFRKYVKPNSGSKNPSINLLGRITAIAVPVSVASLADNIISSVTTLLLPRRLVAYGMTHAEALKNLGVISGMILPMVLLPAAIVGSLSTIIIPKLSEAMALKNTYDIRRKAGKALHVTSMLAFLSCAVMVPLSKSLCQLIYKQTVSDMYLLPIIAASFFIYFQIITVSILNGIGQQKKAAFNLILGGIIELLFTYYATAKFGIIGFIAGFLISALLMALLNIYFIIKKTGLKLQFVNWFLVPAMSCTAAGLFIRFFYVILQDSSKAKWSAVLISAGVGIIVFLLFLKLQGISFIRYLKTTYENKTD